MGKKMPGILFLSFMMCIDPKPGQAHAEAVKEGEDSKLAQEQMKPSIFGRKMIQSQIHSLNMLDPGGLGAAGPLDMRFSIWF